MTLKDVLKMFNIDESKIIHNKKDEDNSLILSGMYENNTIDIVDKDDYFIFAGINQLLKINKKTGKKESYQITIH